jgi:hypothetical protein
VLPVSGLLVLTVTVAGTAAIPLAGAIAAAAVALLTTRHPRPTA